MYKNINAELNNTIENMNLNEKYELLKQLENKNSLYIDENIIENIIDILLDLTTLIAKCLKIIK